MKVLNFIIILLIGQVFMACTHENDVNGEEQYEVVYGESILEEDDPGPPPPDLSSRFKTLEEWLFTIVDKEKLSKLIATFDFALFEGENNYTLCLTGTNTYELSKYHSQTRIEFTPQDMYFLLPQNECKDLKREQVLERLTSELKAFATTDKFIRSFFSDAKSITTSWSGEIWSK